MSSHSSPITPRSFVNTVAARSAKHRALAEARRCPRCGRGAALVRVPGSDPPELVCLWKCRENRVSGGGGGGSPRDQLLAEVHTAKKRVRSRLDRMEARLRERLEWTRARAEWRALWRLLRNRERKSDGGK
jgi:hypothetical protein